MNDRENIHTKIFIQILMLKNKNNAAINKKYMSNKIEITAGAM